jgi:hypothetical protein
MSGGRFVFLCDASRERGRPPAGRGATVVGRAGVGGLEVAVVEGLVMLPSGRQSECSVVVELRSIEVWRRPSKVALARWRSVSSTVSGAEVVEEGRGVEVRFFVLGEVTASEEEFF